jgi:hypothetical protein
MKPAIAQIVSLLSRMEEMSNDSELTENLNDAVISLESAIARLTEIDQELQTQVNQIEQE